MSIEPTSNPNPIYTVVFRTEQVLTDTNVRNENLELFFHRKGDLIRADAQYFVFPGVTELFQRLSQEPHVRLALFSDRSEPYVTELCQQLIKRTLSSEKEKQISTSVEVCSEKNLKPHQGDSRSYGLKSREHQIDLRDLVDNQKDLDNAVLIETCTPCFSYTAYTTYTTYIAGDQAPNLLVVSPSTTEIFDQLSKRVDRWDSEGYFLVPIRVNQKYTKKFLNTSIRGSISAGKYIKASPLLTGGYKIAFKKRGVQEHGIAYMSEEEHPDLCKSLADLDYSRETVKLEKGLVLKQIHEWIEKHGGECRIQKVCHKVNRIYYVAGVLFTALKRARDEHRSLSSVLRDIQYTALGKDTFEPKFDELEKEDHWYRHGLSVLQEVNSELRLTHPASYLNTVAPPRTDQEFQIIETIFDDDDY